MKNPILPLTVFAALVVSGADSSATEPPVPTPTVDTSTNGSLTPPRKPKDASLTTRINRRPRPGGPRSKMPPAGSAATGGTSSSPGGAPTTPYGSPD